ncbi:sulfite exporter TauE/SafE family protein [soil metagenome]
MNDAVLTLLLALAGIFVGALGTLVGAGGGFLIVPALALWRPEMLPESITAVSLLVVACNAASGSVKYIRDKKVDFRAGWVFAGAAIPGSLLGVLAVAAISRGAFDLALGALMLIGAALILLRARGMHVEGIPTPTARTLTLGAALSAVVGFLASLLGIGGGIMHVPALMYILRFPAHRAVATSHFVLALTALVAVATHLARHDYTGLWWLALPLAAGAVIGAQIGARLSKHVSGRGIALTLAIIMVSVGVRAVWRGVTRQDRPEPSTATPAHP